MKYLIYFLAPIIFYSCQNNNKNSYAKETNNQQIYSGKKIMENKCYVCHNPTTSGKDRIAPPMIAIKKHYILENTSKEEFIKSMQNWIKNPIEKNAKMKGAVRRFGLMPKQHFTEEDIKQISSYIFDNEIDKPVWFDEHHKRKNQKKKL